MIEEILEYYNPWWSKEYVSPGIQRSNYLSKIEEALKLQKAVFVFGLRRVGKTFIIKQFVKRRTETLESRRIFYASLDHPELRSISLMVLLDTFRKINRVRREKEHYLILDEVQHRENFEIELKALNDIEDGLKIIASGSSSLVVKHRSSALAGRYKKIRVNPLDFCEYLNFVGEKYDVTQPQVMASFMHEYLVTGGIPHYVLHRDPEFIVDLVEDIIYKDVAQEYELRDPRVLKDLFFLLMDRVGKPMTYGKIGRLVGIGNDAARKYIGYLQETYLLDLVERSGTPNERKFSPKKCYCADNGLRVVAVGERGMGALAENLVFNLLRKVNDEVLYYTGKNREIDFIAGPRAVEVKYRDKLQVGDLQPLIDLKLRGIREKSIITETAKSIGKIRTVPLWRFAGVERS